MRLSRAAGRFGLDWIPAFCQGNVNQGLTAQVVYDHDGSRALTHASVEEADISCD